MVPSVFISSTIIDLHHLRSAVRDTIKELGLQPVMSEYSGVGFLPDQTAETSCYAAISQCQIAVVIIGKRYGTPTVSGVSVTHNEFRTAFDRKIPIYCLVDSEVLAFQAVHAANSTHTGLSFPGLENPQDTFAFISEVMESPRNNAILSFGSVSDARDHIRTQLAHLFGDLLARHADPLKAEIRDVLAEVRTLRHALVKDPPDQMRRLLQGLRLLLDDTFKPYRQLLDALPGSLEDHLPAVLDSPSFSKAVEGMTHGEIVSISVPLDEVWGPALATAYSAKILYTRSFRPSGSDIGVAVYGVNYDGRVIADSGGRQFLDELHLGLLKNLANTGQSRSL
ncbi:MAG: DUF4062 domain-containing protein [Acidobacteriota bacterium]